MADYSRYVPPNKWEITAVQLRPQGFNAVFKYNSIGSVSGIDYYLCRRGCGALVWNVADHIKNVCPTFNPVVG